MSVDACAKLVEKGDPERFQSVMAAPVEDRGKLLTLYAFNLEVARAPWVSKEPMIAEMRLQWWRDVVAEPKARAHEVVAPFHALIQSAALPIDVIDRLIAARLHDAYGEAFADAAAFDAYLDDTAGALMWLAAKACGCRDEASARSLGWAMGLANYFRAVPELEARGRYPLVDGRAEAVKDLAQRGLERMKSAKLSAIPKGARLAAWQTRGLLKLAIDNPMRVADGQLALSDFAIKGGLLWAAITGRI